jgi:hypothetical protein
MYFAFIALLLFGFQRYKKSRLTKKGMPVADNRLSHTLQAGTGLVPFLTQRAKLLIISVVLDFL